MLFDIAAGVTVTPSGIKIPFVGLVWSYVTFVEERRLAKMKATLKGLLLGKPLD